MMKQYTVIECTQDKNDFIGTDTNIVIIQDAENHYGPDFFNDAYPIDIIEGVETEYGQLFDQILLIT